jgi:hypothetical protein
MATTSTSTAACGTKSPPPGDPSRPGTTGLNRRPIELAKETLMRQVMVHMDDPRRGRTGTGAPNEDTTGGFEHIPGLMSLSSCRAPRGTAPSAPTPGETSIPSSTATASTSPAGTASCPSCAAPCSASPSSTCPTAAPRPNRCGSGTPAPARCHPTSCGAPTLLRDFEKVGLPSARVKEAMESIGYEKTLSINLTGGSRRERREGSAGNRYRESLQSCASSAHGAIGTSASSAQN